LGVQTAIILAMVALVSWPQFRPVRPQSIWRYAPDAVLLARANDAAQYSDAALDAARAAALRATRTAYVSGATPAVAPASSNDVERAAPFFTPQSVAALGARVNALLGLARTSLNVPIPFARLVLRDIRTGLALAHTTADEQGRFSFLDLAANGYIVELLGPDGSVIATSALVSMSPGAIERADVRVATSTAALTASMGNAVAASALPVATNIAADSGITRTTPALTQQESSGANPGAVAR
jgi:hypothetical protein